MAQDDHTTARNGPRKHHPFTLIFGLALLGLCGCAHYPLNTRLQHSDPADGYRFNTLAHETNSNSLLITLAFSGGGTRAAALSYGVLEELARTEISLNGQRKRMLDEVDSISSVSGGSFTAAYYALYGDKIFTDFETAFLERNVQTGLFLKFASPLGLIRLLSPWYSRGDLAAEYLDDHVFKRATFADLIAHGRRPYLTLNATDMALGARFEFTQDQFDLIGSDLSTFSVARAVTASTAIPVFLTPISLRNYERPDDYREPAWIASGLSDTDAPRRQLVAREARSYRDAKDYPYVHLMDGGSADNLGLRGPLNGVIAMGGAVNTIREFKLDQVRRVVLIVVNASTGWNLEFSRHEKPPGMFQGMMAAGGVPVANYSVETLALFRQSIEKWSHELQLQRDSGDPNGPAEIEFYPIVVNFDSLTDESERQFFESVPTNFNLPHATVVRLRAVAGKLLRQSESFQKLLRDLREQSPLQVKGNKP